MNSNPSNAKKSAEFGKKLNEIGKILFEIKCFHAFIAVLWAQTLLIHNDPDIE
jgi:hypothetical protein